MSNGKKGRKKFIKGGEQTTPDLRSRYTGAEFFRMRKAEGGEEGEDRSTLGQKGGRV